MPTVGEQSEMCAIEKDVKDKPPRDKKLLVKPAFSHRSSELCMLAVVV